MSAARVPHFASSVDGVIEQVGARLVQVQHQWQVAELLAGQAAPTPAQEQLRKYFASVMPREPAAYRDLATPMLRTDAATLLTLLPESVEEALAVGMTSDGARQVPAFHARHPDLA